MFTLHYWIIQEILTSKLLPSIADRGLNIYDIWQLGYSPINLEKYQRIVNIVKLLKDGFASGFMINYTGPRLPLDTLVIQRIQQEPIKCPKKCEHDLENSVEV